MAEEIFQQMKERGINSLNVQQKEQIENGFEYLKKHKIQLLFEQILTQVIHQQPDNILQEKLEFGHEFKSFQREDFELLFDNYDFFKEEKVSIKFLLQALKITGNEMSIKEFTEKYKMEGKVDKASFVQILTQENVKNQI